ncbi:CdaR family protein [Deinococcus aquatilis]|uniref:CdaR family protein n=1 Tax=Deinococcus aquatilis TaxID=519440 RepID=UPI000367F182|nr:CdaR family protein [Deinococcus aquatilis]
MSGGSSHDGGLWGAAQRWLRPRYVWGRIIHNLLPKVLSLVVALTLWFVATADRRANVEQGFDVPVTVRDTTGGRTRRATSDLNPSTVRVTLSGRPERLRELSGETIEAVVDVTGVPEGSFNRPITVQVPGGTSLRRQAPERVQGFVDAQLTRTLAVTLSVASPSDTSLLRYEVAPAQATVSGAGRVVATVRRLITSPAPLLPGEASEVKLIALDEDGNPVEGVQTSPASVTVRRIDTGELPVKSLRVVLNDPPAGLRITAASVQPSTVRVVAAPELLGRLREAAGTVVYRAGTYTAPVTLRIPAGAQALEEVSVRLTVERVVIPPAVTTPAAAPVVRPPASETGSGSAP